MDVRILTDKVELGRQSAAWCAGVLQNAIRVKGCARLILATGTSQFEFLQALVTCPVSWDKVTCFHLDEYVNLEESHQASFRNYLQMRVWDRVSPKMAAVHKLDPSDITSYASLLSETPVDLACIGIGENGHIAFNDPHVADFKDPEVVKVVTLDEACRQQQIGEGWFQSLAETPIKAATLTIPTIMASEAISVMVPDKRKAEAVRKTLLGPITTSCPSSILQRHPKIVLWLDGESSSLYQQASHSKSAKPRQLDVPFPGLVDLQVNGYKGIDFSSPTLTEEGFRQACKAMLADAVLMFLPTVITSSIETYERLLPIIAHVIQTDSTLSKRIPGIHLEGPFLSPQPGACGCHDVSKMIPPDLKVFSYLFELSKGLVKMITIAADQPGADALTAYATAQGVCVSLGHHLATSDELSKMVTAGAKMLTHLGNGLPELIHRHHNPIWVGLAESRLIASIIPDGHHLPLDLLKVILAARSSDSLGLISDCSPLAGLTPGDYTIYGGVRVVLERTGKLRQQGAPGLAGSASTLLQCVNYLLGTNLASIEDISAMAYTNPLRMIGMDPQLISQEVSPMLCLKNQRLILRE